jgi:hypothetical protein
MAAGREEIRVTIEEDGSATVSVHNVAGKSCIETTEGLEVYLGKPQDHEVTGDYYKNDKPRENWISRQ